MSLVPHKNVLAYLFFSFAVFVSGTTCPDEIKRINIPIRVHIYFAGYTPLFMHSTTFQIRSFEYHLRRTASSQSSKNRSVLIEAHTGCPAVLYAYNYSASVLTHKSSSALEDELQRALSKAPSRSHLRADKLADKFRAIVLDPTLDEQAYSILIYTPDIAPSASKYGYASLGNEFSAGVGVSQTNRFIFVDGAARPEAFAGRAPGPEEVLLTVSRDSRAYAHELHSFVQDTLSPMPKRSSMLSSTAMSSFTVHIADAGDALMQENAVTADTSIHARPPSFNLEKFSLLVGSVARPATMKLSPTVFCSKGELSLVSRLPMLLERAFRDNGNDHVLLDPHTVADDLRAALRLAPTSSSDRPSTPNAKSNRETAIFVLSFAYARRAVRFSDGSLIIANGVSPSLIVVLDNRAQAQSNAPLLAASKAIEMLYGIDTSVLSMPGTSSDTFSQLIADIASRNLVTYHLSKYVEPALQKAVAALNYESFNKLAVSHLNVDTIEKLRKAVRQKLKRLLECTHEFLHSKNQSSLKLRASDLMMVTTALSERMVEMVCSKIVIDDLRRDVEAAKNPNTLFLLSVSLAAIGFVYGFNFDNTLQPRLQRAIGFHSSSQSQSISPSEAPQGQWFSILERSKYKQN